MYVSLSEEETTLLMRGVQGVLKARVTDALMMALTKSITHWTGGNWLIVVPTNSLRPVPVPGANDIDLSRTVGNLIILGVLALEWVDADNPGEALKSIVTQLRRPPIPHGIGYPLLARFGTDAQKRLLPKIERELVFNYVGQTGRPDAGDTTLFQPAQESPGESEDPKSPFWIRLGCMADISEQRLVVRWHYSKNLFKDATIEKVAESFLEALRELARYCQSLEESQL
jgi:non-ribosomal peptide synthase protein (TIGR01720 family)